MPARGSAASDGSRNSSALTRVPLWIARARMHHQPGRLVDARTRPRPRTGSSSGMSSGSASVWVSSITARRHRSRRRAPASRGRTMFAVEQGVAGLDPFGQAGAREFGEQLGQHRVETAAGGGVGHGGAALFGLGGRAGSHADGFGSGADRGGRSCGLLLSALRASCAQSDPHDPTPARPAPRLPDPCCCWRCFAATGCARMKGMFKDKDALEGQPVEQIYAKGQKLDARRQLGRRQPTPTSAWSRNIPTARTPSRR